MRLVGPVLLALSLSAQAQEPDKTARSFLDAVRVEIGEDASLPECDGPIEQICRIRLGRSFILVTEATPSGELLSVKLRHNEIAAEPPEKAAAYVATLFEVLAGERVDELTNLLEQAVQSSGPVEKQIEGVLYRADAGADVLLEVLPPR